MTAMASVHVAVTPHPSFLTQCPWPSILCPWPTLLTHLTFIPQHLISACGHHVMPEGGTCCSESLFTHVGFIMYSVTELHFSPMWVACSL